MGVNQKAIQQKTGSLALEPTVLVVGNGPVGVHFVNLLIRKGWQGHIRIFGEESRQPYNRVQLSAFLSQDIDIGGLDNPLSTCDKLVHLTRCRIVRVAPDKRQVQDQYGTWHAYDYLVLATGSRPHIPSIPGLNLAGVYRFRDFRDVESLFARLARSRHTLVIGGGLLGLETARAMLRHSTQVSVVQHSSRLMNRQLDEEASARIKAFAEEQGIRFHLSQSVRQVDGDGRVESVLLSGGDRIDCDTVVLATGIVPNVDLALEAGLRIRSGIQIDSRLCTSDPAVFAIGECADYESQVFGLVAPGLEQASILAANLTGETLSYSGSRLITELKVLGLPVFSMGKVGDEYANQIHHSHVFSQGDRYRKLLMGNGRLVGALAVGEWSQIRQVQTAVERGARLYPWQRLRFRFRGDLYGNPGGGLDGLPPATVICNCQQVNLARIRDCIAAGGNSVEVLQQSLGVATVCGSCKPLVQKLCVQPVEKLPVRIGLLGGALAALMALGVFMLLPVPSPSQTVQAAGWEFLWTESLPRQISGFTIVGLTVISLLLSLRKRLRFFRWLKFDTWRLAHVTVAALALSVLFLHTGVSSGAGINRWLLINFLLVVLVGIAAAVLAAVEGHWISTTLKAAKRSLVLGHIVTFWPLPVLLGFHIMSVYFF